MKRRASAWGSPWSGFLGVCILVPMQGMAADDLSSEPAPMYNMTAPAAVEAPSLSSAPVRVWSHPAGVAAVSFSPDGRLLAAGDLQGKIWLWPVGAEELQGTLDAHRKGVRAIAFSPDGGTLATGGGDGVVHVWDLKTSRLQAWMDLRHRSAVSGLVFGPDGETIISGSEDDSIQVRDVITGKKLTSYFGHSADVTGVTVSPDGQCVVSAGGDRSLQSWSPLTGEQIDFSTQHGRLTALALSRDGKRLASATTDGIIAYRRTNGCSINTVALRLAYHADTVRTLAFSPDGRWLYSGGDDRLIVRWDLDRGVPVEVFAGHLEGILSLAVSPDGRLVASSGRDRTVRLWGVDGYRPPSRVSTPASGLTPRATSQASSQTYVPSEKPATARPESFTISGPPTVAGP